MRPRAAFKALLHNFRLRDSARRECESVLGAIGVRDTKEIVMAKVIEFYIPTSFRRPLKPVAQLQPGKIIEFCLQTTKSA